MQFIDVDVLLNAIDEAASAGKRFSFLRLSHCETRLVGFGRRFDRAEVMQSIRMQWGKVEPSDDALGEVSARMTGAFREADIVALNDRHRIGAQPDFAELERNGHELAAELGLLDGRPVARVSVHWALGSSPRFRALLAARRRVVVVSSRDVERRLQSWLGGPEVRRIPVPPHHLQRFGANWSEPHYPEGLARVLSELDALVIDGTVVLVAAGLLGKIVCGEVRRAGGIAVDIGSLADAWSGLHTRRNMPAGLDLPEPLAPPGPCPPPPGPLGGEPPGDGAHRPP